MTLYEYRTRIVRHVRGSDTGGIQDRQNAIQNAIMKQVNDGWDFVSASFTKKETLLVFRNELTPAEPEEVEVEVPRYFRKGKRELLESMLIEGNLRTWLQMMLLESFGSKALDTDFQFSPRLYQMLRVGSLPDSRESDDRVEKFWNIVKDYLDLEDDDFEKLDIEILDNENGWDDVVKCIRMAIEDRLD